MGAAEPCGYPSYRGAHAAVVAPVALTVGAHVAFLAYVPSGGFLALRWPRTIWWHVAAVGWAAGVVALGFPCPLTWLEGAARARAGLDPLPPGGFTERYVAGVVYPAGATGRAQALAFAAAAASWLLFASRPTVAHRSSCQQRRRRPFGRVERRWIRGGA